jgi:error-prone DNA polymerase
MAREGIIGTAADEIARSITSFALYGFPESHATSFALLAYASAYLRTHHAPAFYAAILNNQPMGFYHPATLVKDGQRHGVRLRAVDVTRSHWLCTIERPEGAVRLGLRYVTGLRESVGRAIIAARAEAPFRSVDDLVRRARLARDEADMLARIGALAPLGFTRRGALWETARAVRPAGPLLEALGHAPGTGDPSPLPEMTRLERLTADYAGTGVTLGAHPMALRRSAMAPLGVVRAIDLSTLPNGDEVLVAGSVIVRQRPGTAKGFVFLSLEDETGIANVIVRPPLFERYRLVLVTEPFLLIQGTLQQQDGVTSVRAEHVSPLPTLGAVVPSHDFG